MTWCGFEVNLDNLKMRHNRKWFVFEGVVDMRLKSLVLVVLVLFLLLSTGSWAVNTRQIDIVRDKGVLESEDFEVIDNFVAEAVEELVETQDFTSVGRARMAIVARKSSSIDNPQYAERFSEAAGKYIPQALDKASVLTPEDRRFKVTLNLLILMNGLEDLRLADAALNMLNDENAAIRYWAVHAVANPVITKQLNSPRTEILQLAKRITDRLSAMVETSSPETLALITEFAAGIGIDQGEDLLLKIADLRIDKYARWTVNYEYLDSAVLKSLCGKMVLETTKKVEIARRFGQLYSYATQRYVKGRNWLSDTEKQRLASVLVETERSCIGMQLGMIQSVIRTAIERNDYMALMEEHDSLLGDTAGPGRLLKQLDFGYGNNSDGSEQTAPRTLPDPPKRESEL